MVKKDEMKQVIQRCRNLHQANISYEVTPQEMKKFEKNSRLPKMISAAKMDNDKALGISATKGYDDLAEKCQVSITSIKKTINGSSRPTRTFLYRFTV